MFKIVKTGHLPTLIKAFSTIGSEGIFEPQPSKAYAQTFNFNLLTNIRISSRLIRFDAWFFRDCFPEG